MNPAHAARLAKEKHPEHYCRHPRCLWRRFNGQTGEVRPCPKHEGGERAHPRD